MSSIMQKIVTGDKSNGKEINTIISWFTPNHQHTDDCVYISDDYYIPLSEYAERTVKLKQD